MTSPARERLRQINTFPSLIRFLRNDLDWPIESDDFEELTFDYTPEELRIDPASAAKIQEIKRLRPLVTNQPWGVFFVKFEPKQLPVVALRRILNGVVLKRRATGAAADQAKWPTEDLLFISNYGDGDERRISFAHFSYDATTAELPTLKVLAWDDLDTPLHLEYAADTLLERLAWPSIEDEWDDETWRERWSSAFELEHGEAITTSKELATQLAALAQRIRERIREVLAIETSDGPVTQLMKGFREALVHDLSEDDFADMYAQTIAYGLLCARITDPNGDGASHLATRIQTSPFLRELMDSFVLVGERRSSDRGPAVNFDELGVSDIVALLDRANMDAVIRDFGDKNPLEDPVIHFYESFLKQYDAKKRMQRGVFYTPRPVVSYIVRCVDELLRSELGLEDGLADTATWGEMIERHRDLDLPDDVDPEHAFLQILDPATGTGTFLVEVIDLVHRTMTDKWRKEGENHEAIQARWNDYVARHLLPRLHGYELLMAPYAIAHLKVGLKLFETGYPFKSDERVRIYLTNALEPAHDFSGQFAFAVPALAHEAEAVNRIKQEQRFTVVIGNPPYSNFGQLNRIPFILDLLDDYKRGLHEKKINLDDDFIKFVRFAHFLIEQSGLGVVGMITNNVFLDGLTHRRMREALLATFSSVDVLDLHGNTAAHETATDGSRDDNVFDITQGVSVSVMCRTGARPGQSFDVSFSELRGVRSTKYEALLAQRVPKIAAQPHSPYFFFVPKDLSMGSEYMAFVPLTDVFNKPSYGIQTKRDALTVAFSSDEILDRAASVLAGDDSEVRQEFGLPADGRDWAVAWARADLARLTNLRSHVHRVLYRPFDFRWTIYTDKSKGFLAYPRWKTMRCMLDSNLGLIAMRQVFQQVDVYSHFGVTDSIIDERTFYSNRGGTYLFPLYGPADADEQVGATQLTGFGDRRDHNLNPVFIEKLAAALGIDAEGGARVEEVLAAEQVFFFAYATLSSPAFRDRYGPLLKIDFPRLPLPRSLEFFRALARCGKELVALHLMDLPTVESSATNYAGPRDPEVGQVSWADDTVWLDSSAKRKGKPAAPGTIGFRGVSEAVWNFHMGGYQVCQKWLKDRKGRSLSDEDIVHYRKIVVSLSETIRLMHSIDEIIEQHGGWPGAFIRSEDKG